MGKVVLINLEKECLPGNVLDIGFNNYGIAYKLFKQGLDEISVDYVSGKEGEDSLEKGFYDSCIIFFSLSDIWLKSRRKTLIKKIARYIKKGGTLYIWDMDKHYGKIFNKVLSVILPGENVQKIKLKTFNFLKDTSFSSTSKILKNNFEIIDYRCWNNIYCIKGKKEGD